MDDIDELLKDISTRIFLEGETTEQKIERLYEEYDEKIFKPSEVYFRVYDFNSKEFLVVITPIELFELEHRLYDGHAYLPELEKVSLDYLNESICDIYYNYKGTAEDMRMSLIENGFVEMPDEYFNMIKKEVIQEEDD